MPRTAEVTVAPGQSPGGKLTDAHIWDKWFPLVERAARPLSERMIALARIESGMAVLDVGTGNGEPALLAAARLGPTGFVLGIDPDPEMIELAIRRASDSNAANARFRACLVEDLDPSADRFDAVLCRWSLMFVDDLVETIGHLRTLLRPGGRLVVATWGRPEEVPALSLARWTVHRYFNADPPPQGPRTAFALSSAETLARAFRINGFSEVHQEWKTLTYEFADVATYLQFRIECTGSLFARLGSIGEADQRRAIEAVAKEMNRYRTPSGAFAMPNRALCTVAVRDRG